MPGSSAQLHTFPVPIPHDCHDGFYAAFWQRPAAYLDRSVRAAISIFARLDAREIERGLTRLRADLRTGAWEARHAELLQLDQLDLGYRVAIAEPAH